MSYRFVDVKEVEPLSGGRIRPVRKALEIESFGVNEFELAAGSTTYPEHDELKTGQDELFVILDGSGTMTVDGESFELQPGRYVYITPESKRHIDPGPNGLRYVAFGAPAAGKHGGRI
ncbi:MAG TPA: cupin domain-containing protein [Gaiellaceae bacterium]|jgi:mannose-6-phosphate isomerase-like protein (cupin superfamily)